MALTDDPKKRVLGAKQRRKFEQIRQNKGKEAANEYRDTIKEKKGITGSKSGGLTGPPGFSDIQNNVNTQVSDMLNRIGTAQPFQERIDALGAMPTAEQFASQRQEMIDSTLGEFDRMMGPRFQQEQQALQQQLRNQGIPMGSESFNNAMQQLSERQNSARQSAMNQALSIGGSEQDRMFNLAQRGRGQQLEEAMLGHRMPFNDLAALAPMYGQAFGQDFQEKMQTANQDFDKWKTEYMGNIDKYRVDNQKTGPGYDVMALERLRQEGQQNAMRTNFDNNLTLAQQGGNQYQSSGPSYLGSAVGGVVSGAAKAIGNSLFK